jgi:hypothetical protein
MSEEGTPETEEGKPIVLGGAFSNTVPLAGNREIPARNKATGSSLKVGFPGQQEAVDWRLRQVNP